MNELANMVKGRFGANEPVLAEDILALLPGISRQTAYKKIEAAVDSGELVRYGRGVYYVPEQTRFGTSALPAMSVVRCKWLQDEDGAIGYITGATLANEAGLTEQVPAVLEVATNRETTRVRDAAPFGGWRKIRLRRPCATVTDDNVDALRFLDPVTQEPVDQMDGRALESLRELADRAGRAKVYELAACYPAKTSKRFIECEARDVFA